MSIDGVLATAISDVPLVLGAASVVFLIVLDKLVKAPGLVAWRPQPRLDLADDAFDFGPMFREVPGKSFKVSDTWRSACICHALKSTNSGRGSYHAFSLLGKNHQKAYYGTERVQKVRTQLYISATIRLVLATRQCIIYPIMAKCWPSCIITSPGHGCSSAKGRRD